MEGTVRRACKMLRQCTDVNAKYYLALQTHLTAAEALSRKYVVTLCDTHCAFMRHPVKCCLNAA